MENKKVAVLLLLSVSVSVSAGVVEALDEPTTPRPAESPAPLRPHTFDVAVKQQSLNERARPSFYYQPLPASTSTSPTRLFSLPWDSSPASSSSSADGSYSASSEFFSGFSPSQGPFGPFRSSSSSFQNPPADAGETGLLSFSSDPVFRMPRFKSDMSSRFRDDPIDEESKFSSAFPDSEERAGGGEQSEWGGGGGGGDAELPLALALRQPGAHDLSRKVHMLPTRDLRKETAILRGRPPRSRVPPPRSRQKRKRPLSKFSEQQYRAPYSDTRQNNTQYKYFEDHDGNDTYRTHHYRHVVEQHNYYNASDANSTGAGTGTRGSGSYSFSAALDAMREAKKLSGGSSYNVDYMQRDGRYVPVVHRAPEASTSRSANLSDGSFPDGPHVKHHYYYNEYSHDHRNKSEGPTVKYHYHPKEYKVFYHDHRNKSSSSGSGDSSHYSSGYTSNPEDVTYSPSGDPQTAPPSPSKKVKHYHHVKEYHYDEQGKLVDPTRYNYTNKYNSSSSIETSHQDGDGEGPGTSQSSSEVGDGSMGYAAQTESYTTEEGEHPFVTASPTQSYQFSPSTPEYDSESGYTTSGYSGYRGYVPPSRPYSKSRPHFDESNAPYSSPRPVGYQMHYRDYGDHSFLSKDVSFDDGFSFYKERNRHGTPQHHLDGYSTGSFRSSASADPPDIDAPRYRPPGYRPAIRDVDAVTAVGSSKSLIGRPSPSALGPLAARAFPDHTRNLVSRGNIGYILVDPLGELPTIRIHASLVSSSQQHVPAYSIGRTGPPRGYYPAPAPAPEVYPPTTPGVLRRVDEERRTTQLPVESNRTDSPQNSSSLASPTGVV